MTLRNSNASLNSREYERRQLVLDSYPTMLYVELTQNCNLHCHMCRSARSYDRALDMPEDLFGRVVAELMPYATMVDLRGWGESTILKQFGHFVQRAAAAGPRLRLVTNGIAMTTALWQAFFDTDGVVAVSIDAASPDLNHNLGRGDLVRILRNVAEGAAVRRRLGKGTLYFNTIVSSKTVTEVPKIVSLASSMGIDKVVLNPIKTRPEDPASLESVSDRVLTAMCEEVRSLSAVTGVVVSLGASLKPTLAVPAGLPSTCANPWSHAVVSYNGDIIFCDHLIAHHQDAVGNLRHQSFKHIWNSPRFVALRAAHVRAESSREVGCHNKCTWCYSNRYGESEEAPLLRRVNRAVPL